MIVRPPGPFPPSGPEAPLEIDLGVRVRDRLFTKAELTGATREGIKAGLAAAIEAERWEEAAELLRAFVDTWPVAALVDGAREAWTRGPEGRALAVLWRAAELVRMGHGWTALPAGGWVLPDADWLRWAGEGGGVEVQPRSEGDGAAEVARALDIEVASAQPLVLPPVIDLPGPELADRRAWVCGALARGEAAAVRFTAPVPDDPASQLALGEVRLEGDAQAAFERYGLAGLVVGRAPAWDEVLGSAPAGEPGEVLRPTCDTALLPGPPSRLARGQVQTVGWLLWPAPYRPLPVAPRAVAVLRALDGRRDRVAVAKCLGVPVEAVAPVLDELVTIGAATG